MAKEVVIGPYVDYDGILTKDERKKILTRIESAFGWLGATIPEEIELADTKFRLREEIQKLIMKQTLTQEESQRIIRIICLLEHQSEFLKSIVKSEDISEAEAIELSNNICGILRAVHQLRELVKKEPKAKALEAKEELMQEVEDNKRWIRYIKRIK